MAYLLPPIYRKKVTLSIYWGNSGQHLAIDTGYRRDGSEGVLVWSANTYSTVRLLDGSFTRIEWSEDDTRILTGDNEGNVRIWDTHTGRELLKLQHDEYVNSTSWSSDERRVLTAGSEGLIRLWDSETGRLLLELEHGDSYSEALWSSDDSYILTSGYSSGFYRIRIWDSITATEVVTFRSQSFGRDISWNTTASLIALTDWSSWEVRLYKVEKLAEEKSLVHSSHVFDAWYSFDGQQILTISDDQIARVWDIDKGLIKLELAHAVKDPAAPALYESKLQLASWSPSGQQILTTGRDLTRVWDASTGELLVDLLGESSASWSHDGSQFLTTNRADKIWIRDSATGKNVNHLTHRGYLVTQAQWSPDDQRIAIIATTPGFLDRKTSVWIWDLQTRGNHPPNQYQS